MEWIPTPPSTYSAQTACKYARARCTKGCTFALLDSLDFSLFFLFLSVLSFLLLARFVPRWSSRCLLDVPPPARLLAVSLRSQSRREVIFITDHGCHLFSRSRLTVAVHECKYRDTVARKISLSCIESIPGSFDLTISKYTKYVHRWKKIKIPHEKSTLRRTKNEITCNDMRCIQKHYRSPYRSFTEYIVLCLTFRQ